LGEIVNLRQARKQKRRRSDEAAAAQNRALFGRSKAERLLADREKAKQTREIEAHRIARPDAD
jgi:uncharacterized protein DUF4169